MTGTKQLAEVNTGEDSATQVALEPRSIVWFSQKVQVIIATLLIVVVIGVCFGCTLGIGFLLDDFLHMEYSMKALHHEWSPLIKNLTGNWGESDLMKAYRPLTTVSIFLDAIVARTFAPHFHFTNLLLFFVCCCLVSLLTLELTGRTGNRMSGAAALWAGLLFAVYPLHLESVAWITGRVDVLCTLFYLASVFLFLRFQLIRETSFLCMSLVCFWLALLSKEMAVTVPAVVTLAAFMLKPDVDNATIKKRLLWVGTFWVSLGAFLVLRNAALGTTLGGYREITILDILHSLLNFLDKATLAKIFVPINEHYHPLKAVALWLVPAYIGIGACLFAKMSIMRGRKVLPLLFLTAWIALAVAPTFQIWHIYPNLVGSRLFFLASAPFCILLAMAALPTVELLGAKAARVTTMAGTLCLLYLFCAWGAVTKENMQAWIDAGNYMQTFKKELHAIAARFKDSEPIVVMNLPRDNCGAGMITRQRYLDILMTPSFTPGKNGRLHSIEAIVTGDPSLIWPDRFRHQIDGLGDGQVVSWSTVSHGILPWSKNVGGSTEPIRVEKVAKESFTAEPPCTVLEPGTWNRVLNNSPWLEPLDGKLRVYPGERGGGVTLWLNSVSEANPLNPRELNALVLNLVSRPDEQTSDQSEGPMNGATVVWETSDRDNKSGEAVIARQGSDCLAWLGRYRTWTLARSITKLGLHFNASNRCFELGAIKLLADSSIAPRASLKLPDGTSSNENARRFPLTMTKDEADNLVLRYNAGELNGINKQASTVEALISDTNQTFDPSTAHFLLHPKLPLLASRFPCKGVSGEEPLPKTFYNNPGYHEIQIRALDNKGVPVGVPSEPIPILITEK